MTLEDPHNPTRRAVFRRRHRLSRARDYQRVYREGQRRTRGPLMVAGAPNALPHARLGLSVGRRVGNAVARSRVKRLLREAFRLSRGEMPAGYDLVIAVRPHAALELDEYRRLLVSAWGSIDRAWRERRAGAEVEEPPDDGAA